MGLDVLLLITHPNTCARLPDVCWMYAWMDEWMNARTNQCTGSCQPRFLQSQNSGSPRVVSHAWVFALGLLADSLLTQLSRARGAMPRDFPRLRCCDYSFAAVLVNHSIVKLTVYLCRWCRCMCGPQAPLGEIVYSRSRVGPYLSLAVRACCNLARLRFAVD